MAEIKAQPRKEAATARKPSRAPKKDTRPLIDQAITTPEGTSTAFATWVEAVVRATDGLHIEQRVQKLDEDILKARQTVNTIWEKSTDAGLGVKDERWVQQKNFGRYMEQQERNALGITSEEITTMNVAMETALAVADTNLGGKEGLLRGNVAPGSTLELVKDFAALSLALQKRRVALNSNAPGFSGKLSDMGMIEKLTVVRNNNMTKAADMAYLDMGAWGRFDADGGAATLQASAATMADGWAARVWADRRVGEYIQSDPQYAWKKSTVYPDSTAALIKNKVNIGKIAGNLGDTTPLSALSLPDNQNILRQLATKMGVLPTSAVHR